MEFTICLLDIAMGNGLVSSMIRDGLPVYLLKTVMFNSSVELSEGRGYRTTET
jgi:hypothetical protein